LNGMTDTADAPIPPEPGPATSAADTEPGDAEPGDVQPVHAEPRPAESRELRVAAVWSVLGFALAVLPPFTAFGLVASIVGLVLSRRAGRVNRFAVAGILSALVLMAAVVAFIVALGSSGFAIFGTSVGGTVWVCSELGPGEHVVDGLRYTCR
jgi:hypothetical protein